MARWTIAAAAVAGERHIADHRACEDAFAVRNLAGPKGHWLILAASDGAGSAQCAASGSARAACAFVDAAASGLVAGSPPSDDALRSWLASARREVEMIAAASARPLRDHAATLLAAVVGDRAAAFVQIGDGAIVVAGDEPGAWSWMFEPHRGQYANETSFLTDADAVAKASVAVLDHAPSELALFTDGLENMLIEVQPSRRVVSAFFDRMLPPVRNSSEDGLDRALSDHLARYLQSEPVARRSDDDRTLILASRMRVKADASVLRGVPCAAP